MTEHSLFSFEPFSSLMDSDLADYVEPFLATDLKEVPASVFDQLSTSLSDWDECHLVYALELCMRLDPVAFGRKLVPFLSHHDGSVSCAAYRLLKSHASSRTLADLVPEILSIPVVNLFAKDPRSGETRLIGTNEPFLRDLAGKATIESGNSAML